MKAAILGDMHGNSIALDEVLKDIQSIGGVDEYWFLGDYAAIGHDPLGVMAQIADLPGARFIRGNTDRYLCTGEIPWPQYSDVMEDPRLAQQHFDVVRSFAWTMGAVSAAGWLPWFRNLPLELYSTLPDGSRVLAVHAAPGTDDGRGIDLNTSDEALSHLVSGVAADLIFVGHTHVQIDRTSGKVRVVNAGSVSNPFPPDLRASYVILEADENGYEIVHRRVDYDREAVVQAVKAVNHPAAEYISKFMRGENKKAWMK